MQNPQALPYELVGQPYMRTLTADDFTAGQQTLGVNSAVAYFEVPRGSALVLEKDSPMFIYLKAEYETAIATSVDTAFVANLGALGIRLIESARVSPAFPTPDHLDVSVDISSNGGATWAETEVISVNWLTNTVSFTKVAGTNRYRVRYLAGDGELQLVAEVPQGSDGSSAVLFNSALRVLHESNQNEVSTSPKLGIARPLFLAPEFRLVLKARSNSKFMWGAAAENLFSLPVRFAPIRVLDGPTLSRVAEQALKG